MRHWWALPVLALAGGPVLAAITPDGAVADCRRPGSGTERAICASPALQAADQALAAVFAEWRQRAADAAAAQASQQDWLQRRTRMCGEAQRPQCLAIAYEEREAWLRAQLARLPSREPAPSAAAAPPQPEPSTPPRPQPELPLVQTPPPAVAAVPQPPPAAATAALPQPAPPRVLVPAVPPAVSVLSFAARLASAPCGAVSSTVLRQQGWSATDAPFGLAQPRWSQGDYAALIRRATECQAENMDSGRNLSLMTNLLNTLRANAPAVAPSAGLALPAATPSAPSPQPQPQPQPQPLAPQSAAPGPQALPPVAAPPVAPPLAPAPAQAIPVAPVAAARPNPAPGAAPVQEPLALNCGDPALLQDVAYTFQSTPAVAAGARIQQMLRPRAYSDVVMEAYAGTPALRAEYQRLLPYMAPVPQCLVDVETSTGRAVLSYRLYAEGGRTLIEVQRVP